AAVACCSLCLELWPDAHELPGALLNGHVLPSLVQAKEQQPGLFKDLLLDLVLQNAAIAADHDPERIAIVAQRFQPLYVWRGWLESPVLIVVDDRAGVALERADHAGD